MKGGTWKLRFADLLAFWLAVLTGFYFRFYSDLIPVFTSIPELSLYIKALFLLSPFYVLILGGLGNYPERIYRVSEYEIHNLFRSLGFFFLVCVSLTFFIRSYEFSRITLLLSFFLNFLFVVFFRSIFARILHHGKVPDRILLIGENSQMLADVKNAFQATPEAGTITGVLQKAELSEITFTGIDRLLIVGGELSYADVADLLLHAPRSVRIDLIPGYHIFLRHLPFYESIGWFPVLPLSHQQLSGWSPFIKRALDICISILFLITTLPFLIVITFTIRMLYGSPVFFRQERVGQNGRPFLMYKFRTMKVDAEQSIASLVTSEKKPNYKWRNDPRVLGQFARFLRRTSLDEIPQFWNVLQGSMSLVGPRPAPLEFVRNYSAVHKLRLAIPPGMTGLQQISCRGSESMDEILQYDLKYIREQSLWLDLVILIKTIPSVLFGKGIQ
jgi:exopolysaccharide biosynthesis polyprenyl glycosylphosphotransferase